jgi:Tol biopolymer transport system component
VLALAIAGGWSLQHDVASTETASASASKGRKSVGLVDEILEDTVLLRGSKLTRTGDPLYSGDVLNTKKGGSVVFKISLRHAICTLVPGAVLAVRPSKLKVATLRLGKVLCFLERSTGKRHAARAMTGGNPSGIKTRFEAGPTTIRADNALLSIKVTARRKVVVKVVRGIAVVSSRKGGAAAAVVVGKKRQVTIPAGQKPLLPNPITLNKGDRSAFRTLGPLPRPADNSLPTVTITRKPEQTTLLRDATFAFKASQGNVIFSCSLDQSPLRLCPNPATFTDLAPGSHTFSVQGTDQAGNTSKRVSHSWTIERPAPPRIAFESQRDGNPEIYVMNPDGSNQTRLTTNPALDTDPDWSPDRKKLVFHSNRDGNPEIYVMNADGTGQARLTSSRSTDRNATWSPDGKKIAFETYRDGAGAEIYVMNADGTGLKRLTDNQVDDFDAAWSPDGAKIAFARGSEDGNQEIYLMNANGSGQTNLTRTTQAREFNPAWSPDGTHIAFHSNRDQGNWEIYVMRSNGSAQTRITDNCCRDFNPIWSPDGDKIAFQTDRDDRINDTFEIYVMNPDGSSLRRLTNNSWTDQVPDW